MSGTGDWKTTVGILRGALGDDPGPAIGPALLAQLAGLVAPGRRDGPDPDSRLWKFYTGALTSLGGIDPTVKELAIVAILAERRATQNLAVHFLLAKLYAVPEDRIDEVLAIVGVYSGADALTDALEVRRAVEALLAELPVDDLPATRAEVAGMLLGAIRRQFPS